MENNKFPHLMIDLETMGQGANAVICSLAAVPFHMDGRVGQPFTQNIDIQSCLDAGLQVTGDTIYWWLEKSEEARLSLLPNRKPLFEVLFNLDAFIILEMQEDFKIWGKGPSFDLSILADAYRICKINIPWKYSNERCVRTAIDGHEDYLKESLPNLGVLHQAEADALHQVEQVQMVHRLTLASRYVQ